MDNHSQSKSATSMSGKDLSNFMATTPKKQNGILSSIKDKKEKIYLSKLRFENYSEDEYVECAICGFCGRELTRHIRMEHDMSNKQYIADNPAHKTKSQKIRGAITGKNNPAYNHGGRLSPFSKKFLKGDIVDATKKKAKQSKIDNNSHTTQLPYWLEKTGGDEDEARKLLSERQSTFSLDICIKKHGEEKGTEIWQDRQDRWQKTLNDKPPEELERIARAKMGASGSISKAEKEIFEKLKDSYPEMDNQLVLNDVNGKKLYIYDIVFKNKIIEYNGDYWHCNPAIYDDTFFNKSKHKSSIDIWKRDEERASYARAMGYEILIIWERDYKKSPRDIINKCTQFLNG